MGTLGRLFAPFRDGYWADRRFRRQLKKAPSSVLGSLEENTFARVSGTVRPFGKRLLEAPLSGRLCVYYSFDVVSTRGVHDTIIGTEDEGMTFLLEDETGCAVIDPAHAVFSVGFDHETRSKAAFDATPKQREILERLDLIRRNWILTDHLVYREAILEIDETIAVLGAGVREPDPEAVRTGLYRDDVAQRMRFTGTAKYPLVITDDPRSL